MPSGPVEAARQQPAPPLQLQQRPLVERLQPHLQLNHSAGRMPILGLGTWNAQGKELKEAVKAAIQIGYRHIDTATNYRNEHLVGQAIAECINARVCKREDLFVTTKLWNNSHSRASVHRALLRALNQLQLTYVDLYLVHYPIGYQEGDELSPLDAQGNVLTSQVDYLDTWLGMEDVQRLGFARAIGVSNFSAKQLARLLANCQLRPAVNQVECHPYLSQEPLLKFCRAHGIQLTAYSPLGSPGRRAPNSTEPHLLEEPLVLELAKKHLRSPAHILIRYQIQRQVSVIPKAISLAHLRSNFESLTFELSAQDMIRLAALNRNHRFMKFERCLGHKYYPFNDDDY